MGFLEANFHLPAVDSAAVPVEDDNVARRTGDRAQRARFLVRGDVQVSAANDCDLAQFARHDGGMARPAAACRQHAGRRLESLDILSRDIVSYRDDTLPLGGHVLANNWQRGAAQICRKLRADIQPSPELLCCPKV